MRAPAILVASVLALVLAFQPATSRAAPQPAGWKAVLIAGDDEEAAFDNAVDAMAGKLASFGVPSANIAVLKASDEDAGAATAANIKGAIAGLAPGPGEGCFVYLTSHGRPERGLLMTRARAYLSAVSLAHMLDESCGTSPTVVIASGCYSGSFADEKAMATESRVVLTAARADRPSFGCNAHLVYTVFDQCILASLDRGLGWTEVMDKTRACVSGNEFDMRVKAPSEPQLWIGSAEAELRVFAP